MLIAQVILENLIENVIVHYRAEVIQSLLYKETRPTKNREKKWLRHQGVKIGECHKLVSKVIL